MAGVVAGGGKRGGGSHGGNTLTSRAYGAQARPADRQLAARDRGRPRPGAPEGAVEQIVRRVGEAIGAGILEPGAQLPPEAELAARLEVAPMTLRQALAVLRSAGFIETRRGRGGGSFVREVELPSPSPGFSARGAARPDRLALGDLGRRRRARRRARAGERARGAARARRRGRGGRRRRARLPACRCPAARRDRRGEPQPPARLGRDAAAGRARRGARAGARTRARPGDVAGRATGRSSRRSRRGSPATRAPLPSGTPRRRTTGSSGSCSAAWDSRSADRAGCSLAPHVRRLDRPARPRRERSSRPHARRPAPPGVELLNRETRHGDEPRPTLESHGDYVFGLFLVPKVDRGSIASSTARSTSS